MADPAASIAALEDALASGELTVEIEGKRITYRSVVELRQALGYFKMKQAEQAGGASSSYVSFARD